jgi:hypothetical protein
VAITTNRAIPYPGVNDAPDGPYSFQGMAEAIDVDLDTLFDQAAADRLVTTSTIPLNASLYVAYGTINGTTYETPLARKFANGNVDLGGSLGMKTGLAGDQIVFTTGVRYTVATLPAGLRPAATRIFEPIVSFNMRAATQWRIYINPDGTIQLEHNYGSNVTVLRPNFLVSFDQMKFWQ